MKLALLDNMDKNVFDIIKEDLSLEDLKDEQILEAIGNREDLPLGYLDYIINDEEYDNTLIQAKCNILSEALEVETYYLNQDYVV